MEVFCVVVQKFCLNGNIEHPVFNFPGNISKFSQSHGILLCRKNESGPAFKFLKCLENIMDIPLDIGVMIRKCHFGYPGRNTAKVAFE